MMHVRSRIDWHRAEISDRPATNCVLGCSVVKITPGRSWRTAGQECLYRAAFCWHAAGMLTAGDSGPQTLIFSLAGEWRDPNKQRPRTSPRCQVVPSTRSVLTRCPDMNASSECSLVFVSAVLPFSFVVCLAFCIIHSQTHRRLGEFWVSHSMNHTYSN